MACWIPEDGESPGLGETRWMEMLHAETYYDI
jgi:hypothetical protein